MYQLSLTAESEACAMQVGIGVETKSWQVQLLTVTQFKNSALLSHSVSAGHLSNTQYFLMALVNTPGLQEQGLDDN